MRETVHTILIYQQQGTEGKRQSIDKRDRHLPSVSMSVSLCGRMRLPGEHGRRVDTSIKNIGD